jgi:hypothetical protein
MSGVKFGQSAIMRIARSWLVAKQRTAETAKSARDRPAVRNMTIPGVGVAALDEPSVGAGVRDEPSAGDAVELVFATASERASPRVQPIAPSNSRVKVGKRRGEQMENTDFTTRPAYSTLPPVSALQDGVNPRGPDPDRR